MYLIYRTNENKEVHVYLSASIAAMSSGFLFLQVYQWWPNSWHIGHSCFFDFFLLPPSTVDFILLFLLPLVDLRHGGCMKKPCVALGHMDLSGMHEIEPA
jgi:hypothetical protein